MANAQRLHLNAPGDFYSTGDCIHCGAPESMAPDLLAPLTPDNWLTYFVRQPQTADEVERACQAVHVCCVDALRYNGGDPAILARLGNRREFCDYPMPGGPIRYPGETDASWTDACSKPHE